MDKEAMRLYMREWRAKNPDRLAAYAKKRSDASATARRWGTKKTQLEKKYGITTEDHEQMLKEQGGACAICKEVGPLVVDHCHQTTVVRGLLCSHCNLGLGHFKDNAGTLRAAANYLEL